MSVKLIVPPLAVLEAVAQSGSATFTLQPDVGDAREITGEVGEIERYFPTGSPMERPEFRRVSIVLEFPGLANIRAEIAAPVAGGEARIDRAELLFAAITPAALLALLPPPEAIEVRVPNELLSRRVEEIPELKPFLPILQRSGVLYVGEACMIPVRRGGKGKGPNIGLRLRMALESIGIPQTYHPTNAGPYAWRPPYWDDPTLAPKLRQMAIDFVGLDEDDVPGTPWYRELTELTIKEWIILVRKNRMHHGDPEQVDLLGWSFERLHRVQSRLRVDRGLHAAMIFPPNLKET